MAEVRLPHIENLYDKTFKPYFLQKRDYLFAGLMFLISFVLYLMTLTPHICAGDSGELTTAIYNLGAAHPPGYPLYTMLGKIFTYIPISSIAYRVNLLSAFFGALTIPFLFLFIIKMIRTSEEKVVLFRDYAIASACSLLFAFSSTMWSQAVIAEVYTLNIVFAPLLLLTVLVWQERVFLQLQQNVVGYAEKYLLLFAFFLGMSCTNHLLLIGYVIPFIVFFLGIFMIIREYSKNDPLDKNTKLIYGSVIFGVMALSAYLIYDYAWASRLLHFKESTMTILGIVLPFAGVGSVAIILMQRLPDKRSLDKIKFAKNILSWGLVILTALLITIFVDSDVKSALKFVDNDAHFEYVLVMFYITGVFIVLFSYFSLRKQRSNENYFTESVCLSFKAYIFFLIPMLLYVTLLIRANAIAKIPDPPLSWGETANISRVINHFLRKQYPKATLKFFQINRLVEIFQGWGGWHLNQFTPLLLLFVPFGLFSIYKRNKLWAYLSTAIFVFFNFLLLYFLSFRVSARDLFFNEVFFIPSYVIVITWIAYGMQFIINKVSSFLTKDEKSNEPETKAADTEQASVEAE